MKHEAAHVSGLLEGFMINWKNKWPASVTESVSNVKIGDRTVETYKDMPVNLYHALLLTKDRLPEKTALLNFDGQSYTYAEYVKMIDAFAYILSDRYHVCKGDHVGMLLYNGIEFCVTYLALCKLGAVVVSLPGKYQKPELLSLAGKAELKFLVCEEAYYEWFEGFDVRRIVSRPHENGYGLGYLTGDLCGTEGLQTGILPEDPVLMMFTSGTTSQSKGVLLKNYNIMHSVYAYMKTLDLTEEDVAVVSTPMYHITGLVCILAVVLTSGGKLCILKKVDPDILIQCCIDQKVTYFHASPTVFSMVLDVAGKYPDVPSVRCFACGSGNMAPENIRRLKAWMPQAQFHTVFGMTETSGAGTIFPVGAADSEFIGSSGVPMPNMQVKIIDDDGNELKNGEIGEVCVKASFVLEAYYKTETDAIDSDGWLRTGDMGYCNDAGYLYIRDRKKDMINKGGEKICSFDVENEIHMMPGVLDAAVVGIPDEKYMEIPVAAVRLAPGSKIDEGAVRAYLKDRIARFKIPEKVIFVDEIPKTLNGKVDKRSLRKMFGSN